MNFIEWKNNFLAVHGSYNAGDSSHQNTPAGLATELTGLSMNRELLFAIVHRSSNAIVLTDSQGNILYVNKKFEDISGYALIEVLGMNPRILQSGKTPKKTYQQLSQALSKGDSWKGEFINTHKDGREYIEEAIISPIHDEAGNIKYYLSEQTDITALRLAQRENHALTYYDTLTGLPNRAYFIQELRKQINTVGPNSGKNFSVLFADLNRFKEINDTHGHSLGDVALQEIASRFKGVIGTEDLIARIGGDDFVLLHQHTSENSVDEIALRLSDSLLAPISINEYDHSIGVSIGSSTYPADGNTVKQLLQCADIAMYDAKASKKVYSAYQFEVGAQSQREYNIARRLERAIDKNELYLVYQPKVDLKTGNMTGAETLLRWQDPELGDISPAEFIPIAERCGQMNAIGQWVLKQACSQLNEWEQNGLKMPGRLAINLSIQQVEHSEFYEELITAVESEGISPYQIELEVTESVLIRNPESTSAVLASLAKLGFSIAIDDFGTGYSSLSYLKKIQASVIKIDRAFINSITTSADDKTIVKSVVEMANNLGMRVVAEGIEHQSQADYLSRVDCDMAQGFLYSCPVSANEFSLMLNAQH